MHVLQNISYSSPPRCTLDIYIPENTGTLPVLMAVHGGAWMIGDKSKIRPQCEYMAQKLQCIVVAPNYQLSAFPVTLFRKTLLYVTLAGLLYLSRPLLFIAFMTFIWITFSIWCDLHLPTEPTQCNVTDLFHAILWIKTNITNYGGNQTLFLFGHSAGAHLVSLCSTQIGGIAGVICLSGVYNAQRLQQTPFGSLLLHSVFGDTNYRTVFPLHHIHHRTPPHLLINARWDLNLPKHTKDMERMFQLHNIYVKICNFGGHHFNIMKHWDTHNACVFDEIQSFFRMLNK